MRVRVIYNPVSGRRPTVAVLERLRRALDRVGYTLDAVRTSGPGDATRLAAETPADVRALIVAGGDGTVREAVTGLVGRSVPVVIWRRGTENVLAKHLRCGRSVRRIVEAVLGGREVAYDLGICNERYFALHAGVGFDADLVRRVSERRTGHSAYRHWIGPGYRTLRDYNYPPVSVTVDGREVFSGQALVWVGILPRYALGITLLPGARVNDGLLDVCILPCRSRRQLVLHGLRMLSGRHLRADGARYLQGCRATVHSLGSVAVPLQIDGDSAGTLPITCGVLPSAVRFLLPSRSG